MNLSYVANCLKGNNGGPGPIEYLFDGYGLCVPSINDAFVVLDWEEDTLVVKDRPILFDKCIDLIMYRGFQMGQVRSFFN
jgi:hypothetical protein